MPFNNRIILLIRLVGADTAVFIFLNFIELWIMEISIGITNSLFKIVFILYLSALWRRSHPAPVCANN
jgi:hypothetical protein